MGAFEELLAVADRLMGPQGCPWDREQTFKTLQTFVIEEAHEVVEAVDLDEDSNIVEELGDLLYIIVFYAKLAKVQKRFGIEDVINGVKEKLIRRHPHVFGNVKAETLEEIKENWERIKGEEKGKKSQGLPPSLPLLVRAQKVLEKLENRGEVGREPMRVISEEQVGQEMVALVELARYNQIDIESALRRALLPLEQRLEKG